MPWFRIDDDAHHHPKVLKARNEGFGAFARMGSWSMKYLTDGHIPEDVALEIAGGKAKLLKIVGAGFLEAADGGYQIHDHLDHNPSADEIRETAATRSAAGKVGGKQSGSSRRNKSKANREANASANAKQSASNWPANREPIPSPSPVASGEATQEFVLSRVGAPVGPWGPTAFQRTWERVFQKSSQAAGEYVQKCAAKIADSASITGHADVEAYAAKIIGAFPLVIAWMERQGWGAPALTVAAFSEDNHFGRCEDVVAGRLDPSKPANVARSPSGVRALPQSTSVTDETRAARKF